MIRLCIHVVEFDDDFDDQDLAWNLIYDIPMSNEHH